MDSAFWSHWAWPLATAVLGFVFFGLVFAQWLKRRRAHQLAWSVGLLMYALAASFEAWSEWSGEWNPTVYRIYIVLAASLVGFLGLGSLYLLVRRRLWGHLYLAFLLVCLVVFFVGVFTHPLVESKLVPGISVGGQALGPSLTFPRVMSLPFNITGSILLIGGAVLSVWHFARRREYAYRMWRTSSSPPARCSSPSSDREPGSVTPRDSTQERWSLRRCFWPASSWPVRLRKEPERVGRFEPSHLPDSAYLQRAGGLTPWPPAAPRSGWPPRRRPAAGRGCRRQA